MVCVVCVVSAYTYVPHLLSVLLISSFSEWPLEVLDASKGISAEKLKERIDKAALIVKTTYWYVW